MDDRADMFKSCFKYFKSRDPPPSFADVIDLELYSERNPMSHQSVFHLESGVSHTQFGLRPPTTWKLFEHPDLEGLKIILNPFTAAGQRLWVSRCLKKYCAAPNVSNLKPFFKEEDLIDIWKGGHDFRRKDSALYKLRWATLGYHHNWNTKVYSDADVSEFPLNLSALTSYLAGACGFEDFRPQAAIVNYYHVDSTLSAHTDHSEPNTAAPLFSISFGLPAIFLLGGESKSSRPAAMWLRSGDVLLMTQRARLAYHAVPRICKVPPEILRGRFFDPAEISDVDEECASKNCNRPAIAESCVTCATRDEVASAACGCGARGDCPSMLHFRGSPSECREYAEIPEKISRLDPPLSESQSREDIASERLHSPGSKISKSGSSLRCTQTSDVDSLELGGEANFPPFWVYIRENRINMNIRQVLYRGQTSLADPKFSPKS